MRTAFAVMLALTLVEGCYTTKVYIAPRDEAKGATHREWGWNLFWGLWTPNEVNVGGSCKSGVHSVTTEFGLMGMVVTGLTGGIVTPITVKWQCIKLDKD